MVHLVQDNACLRERERNIAPSASLLEFQHKEMPNVTARRRKLCRKAAAAHDAQMVLLQTLHGTHTIVIDS